MRVVYAIYECMIIYVTIPFSMLHMYAGLDKPLTREERDLVKKIVEKENWAIDMSTPELQATKMETFLCKLDAYLEK